MLEHKINKNKFVDFCNGDVKGEDTETLNHFDEHTRYQFTRMLYAYGTGMTGQNPFANDEEVEITADIDSATHTSFYVNGQKAVKRYKESMSQLNSSSVQAQLKAAGINTNSKRYKSAVKQMMSA